MTNMTLSTTGQSSSGNHRTSWPFRYRGLLISLGVLLIVGLIGYALFVQKGHVIKASFAAEKVYQYTQGPLIQYNQGKLPAEKLMGKFKEVLTVIDYHPVVIAPLLQTSDALSSKKEYQKTLKILQIADEHFSRNSSTILYFILSRLAVVHEELSQKEKAIAVLKRMSNSPNKLMEDKTHLDLGRLYFEAGDKAKSRMSLNYVVGNSKEDDFVNLARIYLSKMDGK